MSNTKRAVRAGAIAAGLAVFISVVSAWDAPELMLLISIPMVLGFVGIAVLYAPGYDQSESFPKRKRERFASICLWSSLTGFVGLLVWGQVLYYTR
jgi:hypothetical protein